MEKLLKKLLENLLKNGIFLAVMLAVVILHGGNVYAAGADNVETYDGVRYRINYQERWASVCGYVGTATDLVIPSMISRGIIVSEIEGHAFDGCNTVRILEIPDTIMSIDETAFLGMEALEAVVSNTSGVNIVVRENVKIVTERSALDTATGSTEETKAAGQTGDGETAESSKPSLETNSSGSGNASADGEKDNTSPTAGSIENIGSVDEGEVKEIPVGAKQNTTGAGRENIESTQGNSDDTGAENADKDEKETSESGSGNDAHKKSGVGKIIAFLAVIAGVVIIASGAVVFYKRKNRHIDN